MNRLVYPGYVSPPRKALHTVAKGLSCAICTKQACLSFSNVKTQLGITKPLRKTNSMKQEGKMNQNNNRGKSKKSREENKEEKAI